MQSSRFTVKADGKQNSRLVNFVPEQRLPFAKISFIYRKRLGRRATGIKDSFEEVEHEFPFGTFRPQKKKNRTTLSDVPLLPEIFHWNDPKSRVPFSFQQNFPDTFCTW